MEGEEEVRLTENWLRRKIRRQHPRGEKSPMLYWTLLSFVWLVCGTLGFIGGTIIIRLFNK